jgi:C4-dicarboxylate transporter DctQ subunit
VTEVTIYLMGYITFIGAAYALKVGAHVSVDVLTQLLSTKASKRLFLTSDFIILIIVITLIFLSYQLVFDAWDSNEKSETLLSIRLWIPYLSFFIGMVLLLIATILQILSHLSESTNNHDKI